MANSDILAVGFRLGRWNNGTVCRDGGSISDVASGIGSDPLYIQGKRGLHRNVSKGETKASPMEIAPYSRCLFLLQFWT